MTEPLHSRSAGTPSGPEGPPRTAPAPALRSLLPPRSPSSVQSGMATSQALGTRHSHGNWLWLLPDLLKEQGQGTQVYAHSRIYFRIYTLYIPKVASLSSMPIRCSRVHSGGLPSCTVTPFPNRKTPAPHGS